MIKPVSFPENNKEFLAWLNSQPNFSAFVRRLLLAEYNRQKNNAKEDSLDIQTLRAVFRNELERALSQVSLQQPNTALNEVDKLERSSKKLKNMFK